MIYNPEQDPGNRRIEIGPVGDRIAVLRHASLVARQFEDLNDTEELPKSRSTATAATPVHYAKVTHPEKPALNKSTRTRLPSSNSTLDEARSQVAAVLEDAHQEAA